MVIYALVNSNFIPTNRDMENHSSRELCAIIFVSISVGLIRWNACVPRGNLLGEFP